MSTEPCEDRHEQQRREILYKTFIKWTAQVYGIMLEINKSFENCSCEEDCNNAFKETHNDMKEFIKLVCNFHMYSNEPFPEDFEIIWLQAKK